MLIRLRPFKLISTLLYNPYQVLQSKCATIKIRMARKRVVRKNPDQADAELEAARDHYLLLGVARGQVLGFVDFIRSHGVISLAVGIIIGTAVAALIKSLV